MRRNYSKNKIWATLYKWNKNGEKSQTSRRGGTQIMNLIRTCDAERMQIKIVYFGDKNLCNESVAGDRDYVLRTAQMFLEKDLIKTFERDFL